MKLMTNNLNNQMDKVIFTDIDLTLLDFNHSFEIFLRERGMDIPEGSLRGHAHLPIAHPDISYEETHDLVHEFFQHEHFTTLPPLDHVRVSVQTLHRDGWEFVGISACPDWLDSNIRKQNLETQLDIPFREVILSGMTGCKGDYLREFSPSVWVEDNVRHHEIGHSLGFQSYLISHLHNEDAEVSGKRVMDWREIVGDLLGERPCTGN